MSNRFLIGMFILCFGLSIGYEVMAAPYNTRLDPGDRRGPPGYNLCDINGNKIGEHRVNPRTGQEFTWFDDTSCAEKKRIREANLKRIEDRKKNRIFYKIFN